MLSTNRKEITMAGFYKKDPAMDDEAERNSPKGKSVPKFKGKRKGKKRKLPKFKGKPSMMGKMPMRGGM